ncbi:MAG TPA: GAF domain-containing protein, partial [Coleofasciculaceae cyanobacterium]
FKLFHPDVQANLQLKFTTAVQNFESGFLGKFCLLDKQGNFLPINVTLQCLQGSHDNAVVLLTCDRTTNPQSIEPNVQKQESHSCNLTTDSSGDLSNVQDDCVAKINECFLSLGCDSIQNINNLTALCGRLLGATCTLYNRLNRGILYSVGQWQTPTDYNVTDRPEGHICWDVIQQGRSEPLVVRDLPNTHYAQTDPNVARHQLKTYVGQAVKCQDVYIGSLCAVYQDDVILNDADKRLLGIIAAAIGVEEERQQAQEQLALRHRELQTLQRISEIHLSRQSLQETFQEIVEEISAATGFPIVVIERYDEPRQMMVFEGIKGIPLPPTTKILEVPADQTLSGTVARTGQPVIKIYTPQETKTCDANETLHQLHVRTFIGMPMTVNERTIGTLSLAHPEVIQLDNYLPQSVASFANYIASLIQRKQSEQALRQSEERLRLILDNMPVMLDAFDSSGNIIFWNRECEQITGYSSQEIVNNPRAMELLYPDAEYRQQMLAAWIERGNDYRNWEWNITCKDGSVKTIAWSNIAQHCPIPGWENWGVGMDMTERKCTEEALKQQKELLQTIFERVPVMLSLFDSQGNIQWVNREWEQTLGWKFEDIQGCDILAEFYPDPEYRQSVIDFIHSASQLWGDFKTRVRDGRVLDTTWANVQFSDGNFIGIGQDITERKQAEEALRQRAERERLIAGITQHIRQSLNLEEILNTTVAEVRQFLQTDRTIIFRFQPDWTGIVAVESVGEEWSAILGTIIGDFCFKETYIKRYQTGRIKAISDIYAAGLSQCHIDLLAQFQIRANLVVPILQGEQLWGLLIAHHCRGTRQWQSFEIELLKSLATQVAIAIQQSELYKQTQHQAQREQALNRVIQTVRKSLDLTTIFSTATCEIAKLLNADRAGIVQYLPELKLWLNVADYRQNSKLPNELGLEVPDEGNEIATRLKRLEVIRINNASSWENKTNRGVVQTFPGACLMVPLHVGPSVWGSLSLVRNTQPLDWQDSEVELTRAVADQIAIAIQQSELFRQVQRLNSNLERQVRARTAQLELAFEFEATLKRITDRLRDSLDEGQIWQTAVQELARVIGVKCCNAALYDFKKGTSTICYEYTTALAPSKGSVTKMVHLPEIYAQLLQGDCFQFCSSFENLGSEPVSILVSPIFDNQGIIGDLWLVNHKYYAFQEQDIRLVQQVANHCAIAIRQARLYQAAQAQVEELEKLNRLKDDFLGTVSHELRTPLSNIKMATQMLEIVLRQAGVFDSETNKAARYFQILQDEWQREISLINNLLDLSRLDAGTEPLILTTINPTIWILSIAEPFIERASSQQQDLRFELPSELPSLATDLSALERILTELLNNACKYTPSQGTITVSANATPKILEIRVSNSGVEIPEQELAHIFDKFYRIPNNDPWKHGGTGLGLALVKKLIEHLEGNILVSSYQGQTTFILQFPLKTMNT